jgi:oleandomycin transport system ATP-binding protein
VLARNLLEVDRGAVRWTPSRRQAGQDGRGTDEEDEGTRARAAIGGNLLSVRLANPGASADALRRLDAQQLPILSIEVQQPSLDDVFLTLTGRPTDETASDESRVLKAAA